MEDSDYDLLIFTSDSKTKQAIKRIAKKFDYISLEVFLTQKIEEMLKLDPLYIVSGLKESKTIFGEGLKKHFLNRKINKAALVASLRIAREGLDGWKELIYKGMDKNTIGDVIYACFLRVRHAYLTKKLWMGENPIVREMLNEFLNYYKGEKNLEELYLAYRIVRDSEVGEVPANKMPKMSQDELKTLMNSTKRYMRDVEKEIIG